LTRRRLPVSFRSACYLPQSVKRHCEKVILLNIDGCRLDRFSEAKLPFLTSLLQEGSSFPEGIFTIYRALTNPAFASILTGTLPKYHGIINNNLGQRIKVEALPDLVPSILYGSMHVEHFSKTAWIKKIVSLPKQGAYKADDIMFDMLKQDLTNSSDTRLFIADLSEVDFLGHAYGSESAQYLTALRKTDTRIKDFFLWLKGTGGFNDTVIIITSDHGIIRIDHSYLLFEAERKVPFIAVGNSIQKNQKLRFPASIMDIAPTVCYLLGIRYPQECKAKTLVEIVS